MAPHVQAQICLKHLFKPFPTLDPGSIASMLRRLAHPAFLALIRVFKSLASNQLSETVLWQLIEFNYLKEKG